MKRAAMLFVMSLMTAPAYADVTHKLSSSVQLTVDAAATNVQRVGTTYSVSGNNVTTQYTPSGGSATSSIGSLTISSGVGAIPTLSATQATAGESFSFTQSFYQGDALSSSAPSAGAVPNYSNVTSTAAGTKDTLAGTIDTSGTMALTAGGAGTSAVGQFVSEITIGQ
jgi:hypothetical protein|tara:strand:+ start:2774 stop:3277 length:504 start_codon:yes stop_codon:yes gene_type:complete